MHAKTQGTHTRTHNLTHLYNFSIITQVPPHNKM